MVVDICHLVFIFILFCFAYPASILSLMMMVSEFFLGNHFFPISSPSNLVGAVAPDFKERECDSELISKTL